MLLILAEKHDQVGKYASALKGEVIEESKYIVDVNNSKVLKDYPEIKIGCLQGHLYGLKEPEEYDEKWKDWQLNTLPIFPKKMTMKLPRKFSNRQKQIKEVIDACDDIWLCTDSDVEGESLGYIFLKENNGLKKLDGRIWLDGLTEDSLEKSFKNIQDPAKTRGKAEAGYCRMISDWLIGMNYSRLATLLLRQKGFQDLKYFPIGRVQTPTVKLIADRRKERENFKPELSYRIKFVDENGLTFVSDKEHNFTNKDDAQSVVDKLNNSPLHISNVETKDAKTTAPKLNKLGDMQGMMNEYYGFSTKDVGSNVLEDLYNKYNLTSYPRTDSDLITPDDFKVLRGRLSEYARFYNQVTNTHVNSILTNTEMRKKYIDKNGEKINKAGSHHALTTNLPLSDDNQMYLKKYGQKPTAPFNELSDKLKIVYFHVLASTLSMFAADYEYQKTNITAEKGGMTFTANINIPKSEHSFKDILAMRAKVENNKLVASPVEDNSQDEETIDPSIYSNDQDLNGKYELKTDKTKAPQPITESNMLKVIMPKYKLGTQATRGQIVEELIKTGMIKINKKSDKKHNLNKKEFVPTEKASIELDFLNNAKLLDFSQISSWQNKMDEISVKSNDNNKRGIEFMHSIHNVIANDIDSLINAMQNDEIKFSSDPNQHKVELAQNKQLDTLEVICPKCKKNNLISFEYDKNGEHHSFYIDNDKKCHFFMPKEVDGVKFAPEDMQGIYDHTAPVKTFTKKNGDNFDARPFYDAKKGLCFEFPREFKEDFDINCPKCKQAKIGLQTFTAKGKEHECYACHNLECDFKVYTQIAGLTITTKILQEIIDNKEVYHDLTSKKGNTFKARLFYDKGKVKIVIPKNVMKTYEIMCPKCKKGRLQLIKQENAGYTFYKYVCENCDLLFDQRKFGKTFTPEEVVAVVNSKKDGKVFDAVSEKTGNPYQINVKYQPSAMPRNKVKVKFVKD